MGSSISHTNMTFRQVAARRCSGWGSSRCRDAPLFLSGTNTASRLTAKVSHLLLRLFVIEEDGKSVQSENHSTSRNQDAAGNGRQSYPFAQKYRCENNDENYAEFVNGSYARSLAELECAKVANPGQTSGQSGQNKEHQGPAAEPRNGRNRHFRKGDAPGEKEHHRSANSSG